MTTRNKNLIYCRSFQRMAFFFDVALITLQNNFRGPAYIVLRASEENYAGVVFARCGNKRETVS